MQIRCKLSPLLRAALFGFQPDLRMPFCLPRADRAELLFGDPPSAGPSWVPSRQAAVRSNACI